MAAPDLPPPIEHTPIERPVHVHLHPRLVTAEALAGGVVLMVDNLRASVTIAAALHAGARSVRPVLTVEDARAWRAGAIAAGQTPPLLGGERGGARIDGFDLDNSPLGYTRDRCAGRDIVFTTTNGTAALLLAAGAARVLIASLANLTAVTGAIAPDPRPVHVLCAGTRDEVSLDDVLPAGAFVQRLIELRRNPGHADGSRVAFLAWQAASQPPASLLAAVRDSRGGRNLRRIGLDADIEFCARIDTLPVVPEFDPATGLITRAAAPDRPKD